MKFMRPFRFLGSIEKSAYKRTHSDK